MERAYSGEGTIRYTSSSQQTVAPSARRGVLAGGLSLALLALLLQLNALTAFFVGDDFDFLRHTKEMEGLGDATRLAFWGEWEPVWYVTWFIDYRVWGLDPLGFHLTNALWLMVAVLGLYGVVRQAWPESNRCAWAAAALFASHPVHDEAVTYLAARGHVMAAALGLATLWLYGRARSAMARRGARAWWLAAAIFAAGLAALAKEVALTLPVWVAAFEWARGEDEPSGRRRLARIVAAGLLFSIPALATIGLRHGVVGLASDKLTGGLEETGAALSGLQEYLPGYALLGGAPLPFAFVDFEVLERFRWLGWGLLAAASLVWLGLASRRVVRGQPLTPALRLYGLGLVVACVSLLPVFWADLPLRRRYLFAPTAGIALMAAATIQGLARRAPRAATALLGVLVIAGCVGTLERNALYRRSGEVARAAVETLRGAPLGEPPAVSAIDSRDAVLVTLPRFYGGDFVSGAYLFHHTDLLSALRVYDLPVEEVAYALKCYHAEDYRAEVRWEDPRTLRLEVTFRTRRAYRSALERDAEEDYRGNWLRAVQIDADPRALRVDYRVALNPTVALRGSSTIYLYSDRRLLRLPEP